MHNHWSNNRQLIVTWPQNKNGYFVFTSKNQTMKICQCAVPSSEKPHNECHIAKPDTYFQFNAIFISLHFGLGGREKNCVMQLD